jgi:cysteine desulfuration protein SufE
LTNKNNSMAELKFPPTLAELLEEFQELPDWDERYDYLIDLGKQLPAVPTEMQTEANLVRGCMSTVWLATELTPTTPARLKVVADSDSLIVKGLIVVLLAVFNNLTPAEILQTNEGEVMNRLGLSQHLSPQRRNGLFAMVKRIKQLALEHAV